tara:strand:- start:34 stop:480 length:447 start_codon:yes stop_codon:yes gene_type:complete
MPIKTFKGKLDMGTEDKLFLSTNDGMTGYRINKFEIISSTPGIGNVEMIGQIFLKSQEGSIGTSVDFNNADFMGVALYHDGTANDTTHFMHTTIFDKQTFNQDIFVNITDATGSTIQANYYIELEQFKLNLNESTYHTLQNIRSETQA